MRLIDADAIQIPSTYVDMFENCRNCKLLDREQVREIIDAQPTIEPKRGEWTKRTHDTLIAQVNFAYCSECGQPIMHEHTRPLWSFCPNCGARMKGADDEYERAVEQMEYDMLYEPTYNPEDGSM